MRILFLDDRPWITYGMAPAFGELGHEVHVIHPASVDGTLASVAELHPDLLFSAAIYGMEQIVFPAIDAAKVPYVCWEIEDPVSIEFSMEFAKRSILTLTTCAEWVEDVYAPRGIRAISIPFACNPGFHKTGEPDPQYAHDLVFLGNNYEPFPTRLEGFQHMLNPFIGAGYDIAVYGNWWWTEPSFTYQIPQNTYRGYLPYSALPALCASSNFMLGVHSINGSRTMQSVRTFEILGCGGLYLTQWTTAIEAMFRNHVHLIWSRSAEETIDLYQFYSARPEAAAAIRRQGQQFVYAHHTYRHRAEEILRALPDTVRSR